MLKLAIDHVLRQAIFRDAVAQHAAGLQALADPRIRRVQCARQHAVLGALAVSTFQGKLALGSLLMFAFGIGHGIPVLFAGALAPWYTHHPAVKKWQLAAEMSAGYVLVFLALFFVVIA